jgi:cobalt-zinc-cadmium efflux system protein
VHRHHDEKNHDHGHGDCKHDHSHQHEHSNSAGDHVHVAQNKLKRAIFLGILFLAAEVIGGFWANSLALLSDAGHMLTDVAALILALIAVKISANPPSNSMTYGYHRATIVICKYFDI